MQDKVKELVDSFKIQRTRYERCGVVVLSLLNRILEGQINVHSLSYRVKEPSHLEEKLTRQGKAYEYLEDVTDLLGLRVITHFEDELDKVASIIDDEFRVDSNRSVDKRKVFLPNQFGYVSIHKICELSPHRTALIEYKPFAGMLFEIQIRSILQHTWAEIEHDLGYKASYGVPVPLRRRFSIVASLLELADDEFMRLRNELQEYTRQASEAVHTEPENVLVDNVSLRTFVETHELCNRLDDQTLAMYDIEGVPVSNETIDWRVKQLQFVGIKTIKELIEALTTHEYLILELFRRAVVPGKIGKLERSVALFSLAQVVLGQTGDEETITRFLTDPAFGTSQQFSRARAKLILEVVSAKKES